MLQPRLPHDLHRQWGSLYICGALCGLKHWYSCFLSVASVAPVSWAVWVSSSLRSGGGLGGRAVAKFSMPNVYYGEQRASCWFPVQTYLK